MRANCVTTTMDLLAGQGGQLVASAWVLALTAQLAAEVSAPLSAVDVSEQSAQGALVRLGLQIISTLEI